MFFKKSYIITTQLLILYRHWLFVIFLVIIIFWRTCEVNTDTAITSVDTMPCPLVEYRTISVKSICLGCVILLKGAC